MRGLKFLITAGAAASVMAAAVPEAEAAPLR